MKTIAVLFLSIIFLTGVHKRTGSIEIQFKECQRDQTISNRQIKVFSEDGLLKDILITRRENKIKNLKEGEYEIQFISIFGRVEIERICIEKGDKKVIEICLDKFTSEIEPIRKFAIIDTLTVGEEYQINFESRGCFNFDQDSIVISRKLNGFYRRSIDNWKILEIEQIELIREFENKLFNSNFSGGCTTLDIYSICKKDFSQMFLDGSCEWNGFKVLKKKLEK